MVSQGLIRIAAERQRQIKDEGYYEAHDDAHEEGQLAVAAACYAVHDLKSWQDFSIKVLNHRVDAWPWDEVFDKREKHDRLRRLEIAGALIAAEIDRLLRLEMGECIDGAEAYGLCTLEMSRFFGDPCPHDQNKCALFKEKDGVS